MYSSNPKECLCTTWWYGEAYVCLSTDPALYQKNPTKYKFDIPKCQSLLLGEKYPEKKAWQLNC